MSSLNLSTNGPSITKSYQSILNAPLPTGPAASSQTYGQWAIFVVAAPLANAFQSDSSKESVMKVQSTGEGELVDFIEEFSDGRIQFGFLKVKDPNTNLPKNVFVGWCGEGVPERTKGYFTSHQNSVAQLFTGYHVQITARSDRDLTPENIVQKVTDASGSKYSAGSIAPISSKPAPPVTSKPVFRPTKVGGTPGFAPLGGARRVLPQAGTTDSDGWGSDAPPVTRTQLEKVAPAYQPTKVRLAEFRTDDSKTSPEPTEAPGVIRGAYQPVGKVDIAEIRRKAKESGNSQDDRPAPVSGAYQPVGKVDIAAIRAKAQQPSSVPPPPSQTQGDTDENNAPKSLSERSAAFQQSERLHELPKPKVTPKFGGASNFSGTKAPLPSQFNTVTSPTSAPVGIASRTFADQGGKTPAQLWAEKKAREGGSTSSASPSLSKAVEPQASGEGGWKSGYTGKSWAPVQTTKTGQSTASGGNDHIEPERELKEEESEPSTNVSSIRDRFAAAPPPVQASAPTSAPTLNLLNKPSAVQQPEEEEEEEEARPSSPIRVALPVRRQPEPEPAPEEEEEEEEEQAPVPSRPQVDYDERPTPVPAAKEEEVEEEDVNNYKKAKVLYDYEKAEDNEIDLREGEFVTEVVEVDTDWWSGKNNDGETGFFPSNYVEIVATDAPTPAPRAAAAAAAPVEESEAPGGGQTATAQYDYDAAEDNELSFPENATITDLEFPDEDWWFGTYNGKSGLFPSNYVQLDE